MTRLSRYLAQQFSIQAFALFIVVAMLVWITQALRLFDLVTAKGQDLLTLLGQATLTTPRLAVVIISICMGIGLARVLRNLQETRELHAIHSLKRTSALWKAIAAFILGGTIAVSLLANFVNPWSQRTSSNWTEEIAADLLGRALNPNRFSEISPGLVVVIGGRFPDGTITEFFADDRRDKNTHRTFISKRAEVVFDDTGYNISLFDGSAQFLRENNQFSEVAFSRYEISLNRIDTTGSASDPIVESDSYELLQDWFTGEKISEIAWNELSSRFTEILRVISICLLVTAIAAYPHAHRGQKFVPLEALVLIIGLADRAVGAMVGKTIPTGDYTGALIILVVAIIILARRHISAKPLLFSGTSA